MSYKKIIGDEITKLLETDKDPITIYENVRDVVYDAVEYHRKMHDKSTKVVIHDVRRSCWFSTIRGERANL